MMSGEGGTQTPSENTGISVFSEDDNAKSNAHNVAQQSGDSRLVSLAGVWPDLSEELRQAIFAIAMQATPTHSRL